MNKELEKELKITRTFDDKVYDTKMSIITIILDFLSTVELEDMLNNLHILYIFDDYSEKVYRENVRILLINSEVSNTDLLLELIKTTNDATLEDLIDSVKFLIKSKEIQFN